VIKKKHNVITYHCAPEAIAAKVTKVGYIDGKENVADILTKPTNGPTSWKHIKAVVRLKCSPVFLKGEYQKFS